MAITVEIIEHHDIHTEIPNGGYPRRLAIETSRIGQLFRPHLDALLLLREGALSDVWPLDATNLLRELDLLEASA